MEIFAKCNQDWEEVAYRLLAKNFGFVVNAEPFVRLAENLPLKCIHKHRDSLFRLTMVFGVAGLLEVIEENDEYQQKLKQEFKFLSAKYQLKPIVEKQSGSFENATCQLSDG
jgi:FPC/CPF motif-containing protein YcgG